MCSAEISCLFCLPNFFSLNMCNMTLWVERGSWRLSGSQQWSCYDMWRQGSWEKGQKALVSRSVVSSASIVSRVVGNQQYVFHLCSWALHDLPLCSALVGFWDRRIRFGLSARNPTWKVWDWLTVTDSGLGLTPIWVTRTENLSGGMFGECKQQKPGLGSIPSCVGKSKRRPRPICLVSLPWNILISFFSVPEVPTTVWRQGICGVCRQTMYLCLLSQGEAFHGRSRKILLKSLA